MKQVNKILMTIIIIVMVSITVSSALAYSNRIQIKTQRYEQQIVSFNGIEKEVNVIVNMKFKERCNDCNFNNYKGTGRIRLYWFDGKRNAIEFKKITPSNMEFSDSELIINGVADVVVIYSEGRKRIIIEDVPVTITLDKNTNELSIRYYKGTISGIQIMWR